MIAGSWMRGWSRCSTTLNASSSLPDWAAMLSCRDMAAAAAPPSSSPSCCHPAGYCCCSLDSSKATSSPAQHRHGRSLCCFSPSSLPAFAPVYSVLPSLPPPPCRLTSVRLRRPRLLLTRTRPRMPVSSPSFPPQNLPDQGAMQLAPSLLAVYEYVVLPCCAAVRLDRTRTARSRVRAVT